MANKVELEISLMPRIDAGAFKTALDQIKKDFNLSDSQLKFDDTALKGAADKLRDANKESDKLNDKLDGVGKTAKNNESIFTKAFNFNNTIQSVQLLSNTVQDLSRPFVELDTATANMKTLGTEAAAMAPKLRDAAIAMSQDLPFAASEIQTTMFDALASGVKGGEEGLKVFADTAGKLATGGGAAIGDATKLLAGQLNAYGAASDQASKYADIFFNTVNFGVTSIPELTSTLANVVPTASSLGIEIENVGAALAVMTSKGVPTAQSTTKLNALFIELAKPGAALAPILKNAGVSLESLKNDSVPVTLEKVKTALDAAGKAGLEVFSSSEAAAAFNVLTSDLEGFAQTFVDVRDTTGSTQFAFEQMSDSIDVQMKQAKAAVESFVIGGLDLLGNNVVAVTGIASELAPTLTTLTGIKTLVPEGAIDSIKGLSGSLFDVVKNGGGVKGALGLMGSGFSGMIAPVQALGAALLTNPIFLIAAGTVAAIAAIKALSAAMTDTVQERTEQNKAEAELLANQQKQNEARKANVSGNVGLLQSYEELAGKAKLTAVEEAELTAVKLKLSAVYPGMISANKSLTESLNEAGTASKKAQSDYLSSVKDGQEIAKKSLENTKLQISLDVSIQKQELEDSLTDATNDISFADYAKSLFFPISFVVDQEGALDSMQKFADVASEFLFGTSIGRKQEENFTKKYADMIYKAKDSNAINNARIEFANAIGLRTDLTAKQKAESIKQFDEFAKAQTTGLEKLKQADADFVKNRTAEFEASYNVLGKNSKDVSGTIAEMARVFGISQNAAKEQALSVELKRAASDGKIANEELQGIAGKFKLNATEAGKMGIIVKAALSDNMKQAAKDGTVTKIEIAEIAKQFGLTESEAKKVVELQQSLNVEAAKTKSLIEQFKGAYKGATDSAKTAVEEAITQQQDLLQGLQDARAKGDKENIKALEEAIKLNEKNGLQLAKNEQAQKKIGEQGDFRATLAKRDEEAKQLAQNEKDLQARLIAIREENNIKKIDVANEGFTRELNLLIAENKKQQSAIEKDAKETLSKRGKNNNTKIALQKEFDVKLSLEVEAGEKRRSALILKYADTLIADESKKRSERTQRAINDANAIVERLNNQIASASNSIDFVSLTSNLADAQLKQLEEKQQAEIEQYLFSLEIVKNAQRQYTEALLNGDSGAAESAKKNVDALLIALRESDTSVLALIKRQNDEREALYKESVTKLTDASITLIEGSAQREYAVQMATAKKTYDDKLAAAKGNHTLILAAEIEFNEKRKEIEGNFQKQVNTVSEEANQFRINLMQNFQKELSAMLTKGVDNSAQLEQLDTEEKALRESLVRRQITEQQFFEKTKEISQKRNDLLSQNADFMQGVQNAFNASVSSSAQSLGKAAEQAQNDYLKLLSSNSATEEDYAKARTQLLETTTAQMSASLISYASQSNATLKGFAQQTLDLAFNTLQANAGIIVAEIFGKSVAANPIFGAVLAAGLTAAFYGLISVAKGAIGRKTGEARIGANGAIDGAAVTQTSDNIPRLLSRDEGIINARANMAYDRKSKVYNYQIIEWANKNQKPISMYFDSQNIRDTVFMKQDTINLQMVKESRLNDFQRAIREQTSELQYQNSLLLQKIERLERATNKRVPDKIKVVGTLKADGKGLSTVVNQNIRTQSHLEM